MSTCLTKAWMFSFSVCDLSFTRLSISTTLQCSVEFYHLHFFNLLSFTLISIHFGIATDPKKKHLLGWQARVRIIEGIAQGLLYLHRYSRLRIIHRDLKASNILLDSDMNPKISDFGMARKSGDDELQGNTKRIAGT